MSRITRPSASGRSRKLARVSRTFRRNWAQARLVDRHLMALRTDLSRHSG